MRSDLVPISPPPFSNCLIDASFETDVEVIAKQKVTVEVYWPDPHKRSGNLLGSCELSVQQLLDGKGAFRWVTLLSGGSSIQGLDLEHCKVQLAGELVTDVKVSPRGGL